MLKVDGGVLTLKYDGDEQGRESYEYERDVTPRICMPWHPRYLKGDFSIMLRRNVGRGAVLEGLEVRWWLVSAILKVLMEYHHWYKQGRRQEALRCGAGRSEERFCRAFRVAA